MTKPIEPWSVETKDSNLRHELFKIHFERLIKLQPLLLVQIEKVYQENFDFVNIFFLAFFITVQRK